MPIGRLCIKNECSTPAEGTEAYCVYHKSIPDPGPNLDQAATLSDGSQFLLGDRIQDPWGKKHPNRGSLVMVCPDCGFALRDNDPTDEFGTPVHECGQDGDTLLDED